MDIVKARRRVGLAARMGSRRTPGQRQKHLGRARLFLAKALFAKDMDVGDVHIPTAIGNDAPRRRRRRNLFSVVGEPNGADKPLP